MQTTKPETASPSNGFDVSLRLSWLAIGPGIIAVLAASIMTNHVGWFSAKDLALALCIVATVLLRWWEFARGGASTAEGEPATQAHLVRFTLGWLVAGLTIWAGANAAGSYLG